MRPTQVLLRAFWTEPQVRRPTNARLCASEQEVNGTRTAEAHSICRLFRVYGFFFELGGSDTYAGLDAARPGRPEPDNRKRWTQPADVGTPASRQWGLAFDE